MKKVLKVALPMLVLAAGMVAWQKQQIPPTDDPSHPGQPQWCQNVDNKYTHNCDCQDMNDKTCDKSKQESSKCKVYCRKDKCGCKTKCDMMTRMLMKSKTKLAE